MKSSGFDPKADVFDALAHPLRLKILEKLRRGPCCVCKIIPYVGGEQSNVSHHLAILKRAGIIDSEKHGLEVRYEIANPAIIQIIDLLDKYILANFKQKNDLLKSFVKTNQMNFRVQSKKF